MNICLEPKILTHCVGDVFLDNISNNLEGQNTKQKKRENLIQEYQKEENEKN